MKSLILAILVVALGVSTVAAGDYNCRRVSYSRAGTKQLYYYSNGYWYSYHGGNHGQLYYWDGYRYCVYYETVVLVPKAIEVEVHRDHYYSIDTAAQQNLLADAIAYRVLIAGGKVTKTDSTGTGTSGTGTGRTPSGPVESGARPACTRTPHCLQ